MTKATYFVRPCPTCGRMLEIRIELLGKEVCCQHCNGHFEATAWIDNRESERRIDRLLAQADQYLLNPRLQWPQQNAPPSHDPPSHGTWLGSYYDTQLD